MDTDAHLQGTGKEPGLEVQEVMELYGKRIDNEHSLISTRTGWLLTLDAFLIATVGVSIANSSEVAPELALGIVFVVALIGSLSNASCLFSNYWAGRAIDEASLQVSKELRRRMTHPAASPATDADVGLTPQQVELWLSRLRLYGRDPRDEPERAGYWIPPSGFLHPWYMIPTVMVLVFCSMTTMFLTFYPMLTTPVVLQMLPAGAVVLTFGSGVLADLAYHARREGLSWREFQQLRRLGRREGLAAARARREQRGHANRKRLAQSP